MWHGIAVEDKHNHSNLSSKSLQSILLTSQIISLATPEYVFTKKILNSPSGSWVVNKQTYRELHFIHYWKSIYCIL